MVEPKHKMYLNLMGVIGFTGSLSVEPKHKMYLNWIEVCLLRLVVR